MCLHFISPGLILPSPQWSTLYKEETNQERVVITHYPIETCILVFLFTLFRISQFIYFAF